MYTVITRDNNNVIWYFKSKYLSYNWTTEVKEAKKYKTEKDALKMVRKLWLNDKGTYSAHYIKDN